MIAETTLRLSADTTTWPIDGDTLKESLLKEEWWKKIVQRNVLMMISLFQTQMGTHIIYLNTTSFGGYNHGFEATKLPSHSNATETIHRSGLLKVPNELRLGLQISVMIRI